MSSGEQVEFDDIAGQQRSTENTNDNKKNSQVERSSGGGLLRVMSVLPCFPAYQPKPDTPNIDQLKQIFARFKKESPDQTDMSLVERSRTDDLCEWTNKLLAFLPKIEDAPESSEQSNGIVSHFNIIKKFYNVAQTAGIDSVELDTFMNSLQIYESVMSVAFVMLDEQPDTMKAISEQVSSAIKSVEGNSTQGCLSAFLCGAALLSKFNSLLGLLDQKIGEFGLVKVGEFVASLIEVFCRFFNIDLSDTQKIAHLSDSIQDLVRGVTGALKSVFGNSLPSTERSSKWGPLNITQKIHSKLSKFEKQSEIVGRTVNSFQRFFKSVEKIDDNFETMSRKRSVQAQSASPDNEDNNKIDVSSSLVAQIEDNQNFAFQEVKTIGRFFQHLETILSYGILLFKNEDELLKPLLDNVDECTRVLEKYSALHPLYKVLLGKNYLSKLSAFVKNIVNLLDNSNLKINSPKEFLSELKRKYPDLLYLLCESLLNDNLKKKLDFLPDPIENAMNNALDGALNKFKDKFNGIF